MALCYLDILYTSVKVHVTLKNRRIKDSEAVAAAAAAAAVLTTYPTIPSPTPYDFPSPQIMCLCKTCLQHVMMPTYDEEEQYNLPSETSDGAVARCPSASADAMFSVEIPLH